MTLHSLPRPLCLFVLLSAVLPASAAITTSAPTYHIYADAETDFDLPPYNEYNGGFDQSSNLTQSNAVNYDYSNTYRGEHHFAINIFSAANQASAHESVNVTFLTPAQGSPSDYTKMIGTGYATVTINDLIVNGPASPANVTTSLHMHLDGTLAASTALNTGSPGMSSDTSISATLVYGSNTIGSGTLSASSSNGSAPTTSSTGWLSNFTGNQDIVSSPFSVPVNTLFSVTFTLSITSQAILNGDDAGLAQTYADFGNTFSFATDSPVFDLPTGYTANSPSANLIANQYILLPEPTSLSLLAVASIYPLRRPKKSPR
ncbi:MAG TPA: hypothetical protein VFE58_00010 [Tepidisphaeraceae bacterium]|jgi:hypothetical protein|nr:hypothetical protein [Tepidisphaeraceae bacterium]